MPSGIRPPRRDIYRNGVRKHPQPIIALIHKLQGRAAAMSSSNFGTSIFARVTHAELCPVFTRPHQRCHFLKFLGKSSSVVISD